MLRYFISVVLRFGALYFVCCALRVALFVLCNVNVFAFLYVIVVRVLCRVTGGVLLRDTPCCIG